jgi:ribosomal protein S18 acetylase RimI-like enzyme
MTNRLDASEPPRVSLRPATQDDVPFLLTLREQTMDEHFRASGVDVSREQHLERVRVRFECAQIIEHEGRPAGIFKTTRDGLSWELIQIQLAPELQGRGIGERLIRGLMDDARRAGASVSLNVLHANPARRLYERLGFQTLMDAEHMYVMRWPA